jgi:thiol-disulfide isomerase/thioredoxin
MTGMKTHHTIPAAAVALALAAMAPAALAQAPTAEVDPLLSQAGAAYKNLIAFGATVETTSTNGTTERKVVSKIIIQKPAKLAATVQMGDTVNHVVADGTTVYSDSSGDKTKYLKQPAATTEAAVNALARGGGAGVGLLPILLSNAAPDKQIIPGKPTSVKRLPDETVDGVPCDVFAAVVGEGARQSRFVYSFGKSDHLLRRLTLGPATDGAKPAVVETYTGVTLTPSVTDTTFKYVPAAGAVASAPPKEPTMYDERLKVGAAPFPITGNDLAGKPVSLDEYKGKVVLLDFWATWCGPCVGELPNVIAAYNKYHPKGFDVVGISLDQPDSRAKLTSFIKEKNMPWRQIYDGKFWQAANAKAYGVQAIPFTLLIGKDGKIAAVGARGEELAPAIEAALKK